MTDVDRYRKHLLTLARRFGLAITESPQHIKDNYQAYALIRDRVIQLPPVVDDTSYVTALHEMGHLMAKDGNHGEFKPKLTDGELTAIGMMLVYERIEEEYAAWRWAEKMAIEWTAGMAAVKLYALQSYEREVVQLREAWDDYHA